MIGMTLIALAALLVLLDVIFHPEAYWEDRE
jgi:hypothetical protein